MKNLVDELTEYCKSDFYPFHMPGHKRIELEGYNPYSYDVTEVDGLDNLYEAEGILKNAMDRAAKCYGSKKAYYLVNGSTCGIMTAIFATTSENDRILMARNCHGSVYKSVYLRNLKPEYIYPDLVDELGVMGAVNPQDIEDTLKEFNDIKVVVITSPTYEGIVSDIKTIAEIVHKYGKIFIVDEAHGSHLGFHEYFPESAIKCGADIVVQSMHKTMKGLTQTGLLHVCGKLVDTYEIKKYLGMFQTSSPSYVLMGSIDKNVCQLMEYGPIWFQKYVENLKKFTENVEKLTNISIFNVENLDRSKLVILVDSKYKNAKYLYDTLRDKYHLQAEMVGIKYVLAMTSISDTEEGFERLYKALEEIDREIRIDEVYFAKDKPEAKNNFDTVEFINEPAVARMSPWEVDKAEKEYISIQQAIGKISCEYIYMYPPGIPILVPGEIIRKNIVDYYTEYKDRGYNIYGPRYNEERKIQVIKEEFRAWANYFT